MKLISNFLLMWSDYKSHFIQGTHTKSIERKGVFLPIPYTKYLQCKLLLHYFHGTAVQLSKNEFGSSRNWFTCGFWPQVYETTYVQINTNYI